MEKSQPRRQRCVPLSVQDRALKQLLAGSEFDSTLTDFDEAKFLRNWHLPFFFLFGFLRRYVKLDHTASGGDLVMSMIASEIWMFNIGRQLVKEMEFPDALTLTNEASRRKLLPKCNSHSISLVLGLSPETVRRKIKKLIELGWVERSSRGELHITAACEQAFNPESNLKTVRDFVGTARILFDQLDIDAQHRNI